MDPSLPQSTRLEIDRCSLKVANEAGDLLEDRELVYSSGPAVCHAGNPLQDDIGTLDYSSCCRAGTQITFGLVADNVDLNVSAQGTAVATCEPGKIVSIEIVVEKI